MGVKAKIEAALFVSDSPLPLDRLAEFAGGDMDEAARAVMSIIEDCRREDRGIELVQTPEGYEFRIKQEYRDTVASLAPFSDLKEGMLRTLAIIAAKQPIKQSILVAYQGNKVYDYIVELEKKGLIKTEPFHRTKLITTTAGFEKYFGKSVEDVKRMLSGKLGDKDQKLEQVAKEKLEGEKTNGV
jgi:segregation and condensation protein B